MRRRAFLGAVSGTLSTVALAGCIRRGPGPRQASDPWQSRSNLTPDDIRHGNDPLTGDRQLQDGIRGELLLQRGEYVAYPYGAPPSAGAMFASLHADTRLALPFDVFTFHETDLPAYRNGEESRFVSVGTSLGGTRAGFDTRMHPGDYVLVFDNTQLGQARPLDDIRIRFTFAVIYST